MSHPDPNELAERVTELEVKLAYQDRIIADLDGVVREFAERVERLERTVKSLRETAENSADPVGAADEKPPHY